MGTIRYDRRSLIVNGERTLLISGSIHYPRSTPATWPRLLRESRRAGLNCIDTYVFWEGHEPQEGEYNFTGRFDLGRFLDLCRAEGLHVILRFGPYVCAEWNFGGLPWWLLGKKGFVARTWNRPFMAAMERWARVFTARFRNYQLTRGGPVILWQMENEYDGVAKDRGRPGQRYLAWAAELATRVGVEVPVIMCSGAPRGVIETINGFSAWRQAETLLARRGGQPALWTENWPGWYKVWNQPVRGRRPEELAYELLRFFAVGGSGVNYYMWYGGTNLDRDAMYLQTTDYDFGCPLDSYGLPTAKSAHLARLHRVLRAHQATILPGRRGKVEVLHEGGTGDESGRVLMYPVRHASGEVAFVINATAEPRDVNARGLSLALPARSGALLVKKGRRFVAAYQTAALPRRRVRRRMVSAAAAIDWQMIEEPVPGTGADAGRAFRNVTLPHNMLLETMDETDYGCYRVTIRSTRRRTARLKASVADVMSVWVNGRHVGSAPNRLKETRRRGDFAVAIDVPLRKGPNEVVVVVAALGLIKHDCQLRTRMSKERKGLIGAVTLDGRKVTGPWEFSPATWGEAHLLPVPEVAALASWRRVSKAGGPLRWYRGAFRLTRAKLEQDRPWAMEIGTLFKGMLWVNGRCIGRYWQEPSSADDAAVEAWQSEHVVLTGVGKPPQRYYQIPPDWLVEGTNTLIVLEERGAVPGPAKLVRRT